MKKFRLVVRIDNGDTIYGRPAGENERKAMEQTLDNINSLESLWVETSKGKIYLPQGMIQRSYFQIETSNEPPQQRGFWYRLWNGPGARR